MWRSGCSPSTRPSIAAVRYTVLAVGKARPPFTDDVQHYQRLIARHARLSLIEVREDEQVERRIPERAYVSLLDAAGKSYSSEAFAGWLRCPTCRLHMSHPSVVCRDCARPQATDKSV